MGQNNELSQFFDVRAAMRGEKGIHALHGALHHVFCECSVQNREIYLEDFTPAQRHELTRIARQLYPKRR